MEVARTRSASNPNVEWLNSRGIWVTYVLFILLEHFFFLSIPILTVPQAWTLTFTFHNLVSYRLVYFDTCHLYHSNLMQLHDDCICQLLNWIDDRHEYVCRCTAHIQSELFQSVRYRPLRLLNGDSFTAILSCSLSMMLLFHFFLLLQRSKTTRLIFNHSSNDQNGQSLTLQPTRMT